MRASCIAAAILAGGQARRMHGIAKGNLRIHSDITIITHLLQELSAAGISDIFINANDFADYAQYGLPLIADKYLQQGPLGGIASVLENIGTQFDAVVFLPCDLPNINSSVILLLKNTFLLGDSPICYLGTPTRSHPLCVVVACKLFPRIVDALARSELKVENLWHKLGAKKLMVHDENLLLNINTREDIFW